MLHWFALIVMQLSLIAALALSTKNPWWLTSIIYWKSERHLSCLHVSYSQGMTDWKVSNFFSWDLDIFPGTLYALEQIHVLVVGPPATDRLFGYSFIAHLCSELFSVYCNRRSSQRPNSHYFEDILSCVTMTPRTFQYSHWLIAHIILVSFSLIPDFTLVEAEELPLIEPLSSIGKIFLHGNTFVVTWF